MALFNVASVEEDSSGMTLYATEETLEEKWLQYDNMSKHTLDNLSQKAYDIAIQFMNIYYTFINLKQ